ncbi:hypothetical protein SAMN02745202_00486 [Segatella oulorum]|uniref:Uncharacterized protein n=1 Tax=Segatella oulorum TaxID=28136 RepID=A0A1T4LQ09_9BACT|nr:hypothetical protein SAMN02745202_00486 [Segatella oulorum]
MFEILMAISLFLSDLLFNQFFLQYFFHLCFSMEENTPSISYFSALLVFENNGILYIRVNASYAH